MSESTRNRISQILRENGENVTDQLLPLVYAELRRLASYHLNRGGADTLQPTALVHEAYLRLVDSDTEWNGRGHFFAAAARAMRQILINRAIAKRTQKRGGGRKREELNDELLLDEPPPERLLAINEALEELEQVDHRKFKIVMLRYFAGLSISDTAKVLNLSTTTVNRDWKFTRAWMHRQISTRE